MTLGNIEGSNLGHCVFIVQNIINDVLLDSGAVRPLVDIIDVCRMSY